jgi:hypothetical protein
MLIYPTLCLRGPEGPSGTANTNYDLVKSILWISVRESDSGALPSSLLFRPYSCWFWLCFLSLSCISFATLNCPSIPVCRSQLVAALSPVAVVVTVV